MEEELTGSELMLLFTLDRSLRLSALELTPGARRENNHVWGRSIFHNSDTIHIYQILHI